MSVFKLGAALLAVAVSFHGTSAPAKPLDLKEIAERVAAQAVRNQQLVLGICLAGDPAKSAGMEELRDDFQAEHLNLEAGIRGAKKSRSLKAALLEPLKDVGGTWWVYRAAIDKFSGGTNIAAGKQMARGSLGVDRALGDVRKQVVERVARREAVGMETYGTAKILATEHPEIHALRLLSQSCLANRGLTNDAAAARIAGSAAALKASVAAAPLAWQDFAEKAVVTTIGNVEIEELRALADDLGELGAMRRAQAAATN